jgi:hypothetical protein
MTQSSRRSLPRAERAEAILVYRALSAGPMSIHDIALTVGGTSFTDFGLAYSAIDWLREHGVAVFCIVGPGGATEFRLGVTSSG